MTQDLNQLTGSFWGATTFFNPAKYKNKIENYKKFRESSKKQGLNLLAVELAFGNDSFELTKDDADILIQVRSDSIMWQKERLLNVGLEHLPKDCDKVAWLDCDVIFKNNNWIADASQALKKHLVLQLFSFFVALPKAKDKADIYNAPFGFSLNFGEFSAGFAYSMANMGGNLASSATSRTGFAWAARRELLEKSNFFDKTVLGGGDELFVRAIQGDTSWAKRFFPEKMSSDCVKWAEKINSEAGGRCSYIDNVILHLWHGEYQNRGYSERQKCLKEYNFNPSDDLELNEYGCFEWASGKEELHQKVRQYFLNRKEEGSPLNEFESMRKEISEVYVKLKMPDLTTSIPKRNAEFIYNFLKEKKIKKTLEIGFAAGVSSAYIILATESLHYAIDPFEKSAWKNLGIENLKNLGLDKYLLLYEEPSFTALPKLYGLNKKVDFAFIDGCHLFDSIFIDFFYIDKLLNMNGYILFHDTWLDSTKLAVDYINSNRKDYKLIEMKESLALFQKVGIDERKWDYFNKFYSNIISA